MDILPHFFLPSQVRRGHFHHLLSVQQKTECKAIKQLAQGSKCKRTEVTPQSAAVAGSGTHTALPSGHPSQSWVLCRKWSENSHLNIFSNSTAWYIPTRVKSKDSVRYFYTHAVPNSIWHNSQKMEITQMITDEGASTMWYILAMDYYWTIKRKEILTFVIP